MIRTHSSTWVKNAGTELRTAHATVIAVIAQSLRSHSHSCVSCPRWARPRPLMNDSEVQPGFEHHLICVGDVPLGYGVGSKFCCHSASDAASAAELVSSLSARKTCIAVVVQHAEATDVQVRPRRHAC